jgi:hypothetical protein
MNLQLETVDLFTLLIISRHNPQACSAYNKKAGKISMNFENKLHKLLKKHGIKLIGLWVASWEHTSWMIIETPSIQAYQNFSCEPEVIATGEFETKETKIVMSLEESLKLMQKLQ